MSDTTTTMISSAEGPNWSDLPGEILNMIAHRASKLKDFIHFQAVCNPWRRALPVQHSRFRQSVPWLMLPYCRGDSISDCKGTDCCRRFYDPEEQRFHHIELPEGLNKTCRGSVFGWLFMTDSTPSLLNPLTKDQISLPPITTFPDVLEFTPKEEVGGEYLCLDSKGMPEMECKEDFERFYIEKVCLSAEPTSEECVVMVIRFPHYTPAFCRPNDSCGGGSQSWTVVLDEVGGGRYVDVAFWRGQFYTVTEYGTVCVCDLSLPHYPKLSLFLRSVGRTFPGLHSNYYLMTAPDRDELIMVTRDINWPPDVLAPDHDDVGEDDHDEWTDDDDDDSQPLTHKFRVFKVKEDARGWEEVESIGDFALFLGFNDASWVSTRDHPELVPNSIYFSDDMTHLHGNPRHMLAGADMGIYNLATRTIDPFYCTASVHKNPSRILPLPVWVLPSTY